MTTLILKLKLSHYMPRRSLGGKEYSSYLFTNSVLDGVSGQRHAPAALYPQGKDPRYPLYTQPVWTQKFEEKSFRLCRGSNL
jgi:hypothetical protein